MLFTQTAAEPAIEVRVNELEFTSLIFQFIFNSKDAENS